MSDERLNRVIDQFAREMTERPAPSDLRARVLARIEAGEKVTPRWAAAWVLSPLAVAAAMLVGVFIVRGAHPPGRAADGAAQHAASTVRLQPDLADAGAKPLTAGSGRATVDPTPDLTVVRLKPHTTNDIADAGRQTAASDANPASEIEALAPPRLTVESLDIPAIQSESIELQRLDSVAPIGVTPLGNPAEGDRP